MPWLRAGHSLERYGVIEGNKYAIVFDRKRQQVGIGELAVVEELAPVEQATVQQ